MKRKLPWNDPQANYNLKQCHLKQHSMITMALLLKISNGFLVTFSLGMPLGDISPTMNSTFNSSVNVLKGKNQNNIYRQLLEMKFVFSRFLIPVFRIKLKTFFIFSQIKNRKKNLLFAKGRERGRERHYSRFLFFSRITENQISIFLSQLQKGYFKRMT